MSAWKYDGRSWERIHDPIWGDAPEEAPREGWRAWEAARWEAAGFDPETALESGSLNSEYLEPSPLRVRFGLEGAECFASVELCIPGERVEALLFVTDPGAFGRCLEMFEPWARLTREDARDSLLVEALTKGFHAVHGHPLRAICAECDPAGWKAMLERRRERAVKRPASGTAP